MDGYIVKEGEMTDKNAEVCKKLLLKHSNMRWKNLSVFWTEQWWQEHNVTCISGHCYS